MRILPIIKRLKENVLLLNGRVEPARSVVALPDNEIMNDLPIAFVFSTAESPSGEGDFDGEQTVSKSFTVLIAVRSIDETAEDEPLENLRDEVKKAMSGWQYDKRHGFVKHASGNLLDLSSRVVWWADSFTTTVVE